MSCAPGGKVVCRSCWSCRRARHLQPLPLPAERRPAETGQPEELTFSPENCDTRREVNSLPKAAIGNFFTYYIIERTVWGIPPAASADLHHMNGKFSSAADNLPHMPGPAQSITLRLPHLFGKSGLKLWTDWLPQLPPPGCKVAPAGYLSSSLIGE